MARALRGASLLLLKTVSSSASRFTHVPTRQVARTLITCTSTNIPRRSPACPRLTQNIRWMSEDSVKWLRPVREEIYMYDAGERHGTRQASMCATFNTSKPIHESQMAEALMHVYRRLPNTRTCLRWRGEVLWFCEADHPTLDLEVLEDEGDLFDLSMKAFRELFSYRHSMLWRVKLIPRGEDVPCPVPHLRSAFPYQYDFIFRAHHAIGDGLDGAVIMQCTLDALEGVLSGRPVDGTEWGVYDDKDINILKDNVKEKLRRDRKHFDAVKSTLPPADTTPLLFQIFPKPNTTESTTRFIERDLDPEIMKHFLKNVQAAGVSFNSSLTAALDTAIVELAKEAGLVQETYTVTGSHLVSLRGLLKKTSRFRLGPHTSSFRQSSLVSQDVKSHFWKYTQRLHQDLRSGIKSGLALEQNEMAKMTQPEISPDDYFTKPQPMLQDYTINNFGIVSNSQYENYEVVQMTKLTSHNVVHSFLNSNMHQLIIFRDQCCYTLSYDTYHFSEETATIFVDKIMSVIVDAAKSF